MKPKYVIRQAEFSGHYYIYKRFLLLWYRPLVFNKMVYRANGSLARGCPSREQLYFKVKINAEKEISNLNAGYPPIVERAWQNGKLIKVFRKNGSRAKLRR